MASCFDQGQGELNVVDGGQRTRVEEKYDSDN
jgi:hypothetical protein